ncbi:DNA adenine methylase [Enterobacter asburiae]|uniref:DNA adenine methylase n=1 Tax=Enterobacter asburiae TaxID=61645 RepID=UPI0021CF435C|nr:Dam family site-specific DNA-(adenine-N6)-methyltransferase [Enterobacter asburiae]MCU6243866.1 Dam family site-specific DNA-(adenine-N6)-methyltransferase [Enterobacter asburiae]
MIRPFIKWAGGKSRILPQLLQHLPKADCLFEPFVGSASVFLNTDYRRYVLADINPDLINLLRVAKRYPDQLIEDARPLFLNGNNPAYYAEIRSEFNAIASKSAASIPEYDLLRAAAFLYLNRHGYNGLCRYNLQGEYNSPFGKSAGAPYFPDTEIRLFSEKANDTRAIFLCTSFEYTLRSIGGNSAAIYCDPPYIPASKTANFTQYHTKPFTPAHHELLAAMLYDINRFYGTGVVISNSDTPQTRDIYQPFNLQNIDVQRSISTNTEKREKAKEVIGTLKPNDASARSTPSGRPPSPAWSGFDPAEGCDISIERFQQQHLSRWETKK